MNKIILERTQELLEKLENFDINFITIPLGPSSSLITHEIRVYKEGYGFGTVKRKMQIYFDNNALDLLLYLIDNPLKNASYKDTLFSINVRVNYEDKEKKNVKVLLVGSEYASELEFDMKTFKRFLDNIVSAPQSLDIWYAIGGASLYITEKTPVDLTHEILRTLYTAPLYLHLLEIVADEYVKSSRSSNFKLFTDIVLERDFNVRTLLLKDRQYILITKDDDDNVLINKSICVVIRNKYDKDNIISIYNRIKEIYDDINSSEVLNNKIVIEVTDINDLNMKYIDFKL